MLIFAIKDVKVGFMSPFIRQNKELAIRDFKDALGDSNPNNILKSHPEDFELWKIGTYNLETGIIVSELEHLFSALPGGIDA